MDTGVLLILISGEINIDTILTEGGVEGSFDNEWTTFYLFDTFFLSKGTLKKQVRRNETRPSINP